METITDKKLQLEKLKTQLTKKCNIDQKSLSMLQLESVEENIALWQLADYENSQSPDYIYTDLSGNPLFINQKFQDATSFSSGLACVKENGQWMILNLKQEEIHYLPEKMNKDFRLCGFRNLHFAMFCKQNEQWGSFLYDEKENRIRSEIPFIWDGLDFSRKNGLVYVGKARVSRSCNKSCYSIIMPVFLMEVSKARNENYYRLLQKYHEQDLYQKDFRLVTEMLGYHVSEKERKARYQEFIKKDYNLATLYFEEPSCSLSGDERFKEPLDLRSFTRRKIFFYEEM